MDHVTSGCCGHPAPRRRAVKPAPPPLPANPKVPNGTGLFYLGSGRLTLKGQVSSLVYHVSEQRRWFTAHPDDVDALWRRPDVIKVPRVMTTAAGATGAR